MIILFYLYILDKMVFKLINLIKNSFDDENQYTIGINNLKQGRELLKKETLKLII